MKQFNVTLSASTHQLLAPDAEHAAWQALALAVDHDEELIDVEEINET